MAVLAAAAGWGAAARAARHAEEALSGVDAETRRLLRTRAEFADGPDGARPESPEQTAARADRWEKALGRDIEESPREMPGEGTDAYFALARRTEEAKRQLHDAGVATREAERFGFASYRFTGPPVERVAAVMRQEGQVARIVDAVAQARARALVRIEREALPLDRGDSIVADDFFEPVVSLRLPLPAEWGQSLFRVVFVGETAVLRRFLDRFSERAANGFVRWVEVRPWTAEVVAGSRAPESTDAVREFVVTVAFVDWPRTILHEREGGS